MSSPVVVGVVVGAQTRTAPRTTQHPRARISGSSSSLGCGLQDKVGGFGGVYFSWTASFSASLPTPSVSFLRAWSACVSVEGGSERLREGSWRDVGVVVAGEALASDEPELKRLHQYVTFGSGLLPATT